MGRFDEHTTSGAPGSRRRFEPSSDAQDGPVLTEAGEDRKKAIRGRETLGHLVAVRRTELGITQADLAVMLGMSQAAVARIEDGHPPSTDALKQLAKVFPQTEGNDELLRWIERELHWRSPQFRRQGARAQRESFGGRGFDGRWLWAGLAFAGVSAVLVAAVVIIAGQSSDDDGSVPAPAQVVSAPPAAPPVAVAPEKKPQKAKNAQRSEKADGNSAPATESDESSDSTSSDSESSSDFDDSESAPASAPVVAPSPAPSSQSSGRRPGIKHGIQSGGL